MNIYFFAEWSFWTRCVWQDKVLITARSKSLLTRKQSTPSACKIISKARRRWDPSSPPIPGKRLGGFLFTWAPCCCALTCWAACCWGGGKIYSPKHNVRVLLCVWMSIWIPHSSQTDSSVTLFLTSCLSICPSLTHLSLLAVKLSSSLNSFNPLKLSFGAHWPNWVISNWSIRVVHIYSRGLLCLQLCLVYSSSYIRLCQKHVELPTKGFISQANQSVIVSVGTNTLWVVRWCVYGLMCRQCFWYLCSYVEANMKVWNYWLLQLPLDCLFQLWWWDNPPFHPLSHSPWLLSFPPASHFL